MENAKEVPGKNDIKRNVTKQNHNECAYLRALRNRVGQLEKKNF